MTNLRRKLLAKGTRFLDLLAMVITFSLSLYLFAPADAPQDLIGFFTQKIKVINVIALTGLVIGWVRLFRYFGLYEVRRFGKIYLEWLDIIKAVTVNVLLLAAIGIFFTRRNITKEVLLAFWSSNIVLTILFRAIVREYLISLRNKGRNLRFVVFVGTNPRALDFAQKILQRRELGFRLLGFVDDQYGSIHDNFPKAKHLCTLDEFPAFLENNIVDEVFIILPIKSYYEQIHKIIGLCEELGVVCRVPSHWFDFRTAKTSAFDLDGIPVMTIYTGSNNQMEYLWIKRVLDVVISSLMMVLAAPMFAVIPLLLKVTSKGPVFFSQERIGYNKRRFKMLKFRTMVENAEMLQSELEHLNEADGPAFKINNDPRITSVGKWLRKTSLDEIPQLINVLLGDMSLVGPRPLPVRDVEGIDERWQKRRFSMRPGLTCLWQINGRNNLLFKDWMRLDLEYIDQWSISLDFKILFKTIPAILKATGQ